MLTVDALKEFGADTDRGLAMVAGKEALYLRLVNTVPGNECFGNLKEGIEGKDLDKAFEAAHALKGVLGNLMLSPLSDKMNEITEHLRIREDIDYSGYLEEIMQLRDKLEEICK